MKKILFIHHGTHAGGAPLSLLYTAKGVREQGFNPVIGLKYPSKELKNIYYEDGFETIDMPWLALWIIWIANEDILLLSPANIKFYMSLILKWKSSQRKLLEVIKVHNIDLVHLNSASFSNCAQILQENAIPFIWHIREQGPNRKGLRFNFIKKLLLKSKYIIFLSKSEQESWVGKEPHGNVIHNFIDFKQFDWTLSFKEYKEKIVSSKKEKLILYTGGVKEHKGVLVLLDALHILQQRNINFKCLMPDCLQNFQKNIYIRIKRSVKKLTFQKDIIEYLFEKKLDEYQLKENCILLPFNHKIVNLFSICDVLVFPATKPHFARPVIEASAMKKPVIATRLPAINELVIDGHNGLLFENYNAYDLAGKIELLLIDEYRSKVMGEKGYQLALKEFNYETQVKKIVQLYNSALE